MEKPRTLPLLDTSAHPSSWNERMAPGEYAVLYSHRNVAPGVVGAFCTVFASLQDAVAHAQMRVVEEASLQCRIYDHHGLGNPPLETITGSEYKGESLMSPRLRRAGGFALLVGGLALVAVDWVSDFRLTWPATIGARMAPAGLILLVTEIALVLTERQKRRRETRRT